MRSPARPPATPRRSTFTDWAVQDRIEQAHQTVGTNLGMIDQLTALLERRAATTRTRLHALTAERHDLLTQNPA